MGIAYQRGMLLYKQNRYALAADEFRKELSQNPNGSMAMSMLGMSLTYSGNDKEGLEFARAAVGADPERGFCHYALASVIIGNGFAGKRLRSFRMSILSSPVQEYRRRVKQARISALEAVRLEPTNPYFLALMAGIELDRRRPKKAMEWADKGLEIDAQHVRCANLRAKALTRMRRFKDAAKTLEGALAVDPENAATHATSGWTSLLAGKPDDAIAHFKESRRLNPNDPHVHRGITQAKLRRWSWLIIVVTVGLPFILPLLTEPNNYDNGTRHRITVGIAVLLSTVFAGPVIRWLRSRY